MKVWGFSQKDKDIDKNKGKTKKDKEIVHPTDGSISDYRLQSLRLSQQSGDLLSTTRRVHTLKRVELKLWQKGKLKRQFLFANTPTKSNHQNGIRISPSDKRRLKMPEWSSTSDGFTVTPLALVFLGLGSCRWSWWKWWRRWRRWSWWRRRWRRKGCHLPWTTSADSEYHS